MNIEQTRKPMDLVVARKETGKRRSKSNGVEGE